VCGLAALLLLLLGCDAVDVATTRPSSAPADTVAAHDAPASIPPVPPTPTDLFYLLIPILHVRLTAITGMTLIMPSWSTRRRRLLQPDSADSYQGHGLAYYGRGDLDYAIADFTQALALRPDAANIYNNRGLAYYDEGNWEQSIADYTRAIAIQPSLAEAHYNRGRAQYDQGAIDQALADYSQTLALNPDFADAYTWRGYAYHKCGDFDRTIANYSRAIAPKPTTVDTYLGRGWRIMRRPLWIALTPTSRTHWHCARMMRSPYAVGCGYRCFGTAGLRRFVPLFVRLG
jgi:Tfp pilus assembly protein PilF